MRCAGMTQDEAKKEMAVMINERKKVFRLMNKKFDELQEIRGVYNRIETEIDKTALYLGSFHNEPGKS